MRAPHKTLKHSVPLMPLDPIAQDPRVQSLPPRACRFPSLFVYGFRRAFIRISLARFRRGFARLSPMLPLYSLSGVGRAARNAGNLANRRRFRMGHRVARRAQVLFAACSSRRATRLNKSCRRLLFQVRMLTLDCVNWRAPRFRGVTRAITLALREANGSCFKPKIRRA